MVTKRIRSEYMKKFKDPKWETYSKCYEEMLRYRLARRLLEQSHNPWFWNGCDSDSGSSGSPSPPHRNKVVPLVVKDGPAPGCGRTPEQREAPGRAPPERAPPERAPPERAPPERAPPERAPPERAPPEPPVPGTEEDAAPENAPSIGVPASVTRATGEAEEERTSASNQPEDQGEEPVAPPKPIPSRKVPKVRGQLRRPRETNKENRHPFALYGCGEQQAETASRKTHNVCPAASTNEIHESALRAKTRREVERQIRAERAARRRAQSADLDRTTKTRTPPDFDPWVTEYMRCFSARSR